MPADATGLSRCQQQVRLARELAAIEQPPGVERRGIELVEAEQDDGHGRS